MHQVHNTVPRNANATPFNVKSNMTFTTMNMGDKRSSNGDFNEYVQQKAN